MDVEKGRPRQGTEASDTEEGAEPLQKSEAVLIGLSRSGPLAGEDLGGWGSEWA